jgi:hypothetical protein
MENRRKKIKCPHCNKIDKNRYHEPAMRHAENYGGSKFIFKCSNYGERYSCYIERTIKILVGTMEKEDKNSFIKLW